MRLPTRRRRGVTLVELVVVLSIIGLLATMVAVRLSRPALRRAHATAAFADAMTEARNIASEREIDVIVTLDTDSREFLIHEDVNGNGRQDPGEAVHRRHADPYCRTPRPGCEREIWQPDRATGIVTGPDGEQMTPQADGRPGILIQAGGGEEQPP